MAHQYRCDQCGRIEENEDFPFGWFYLESVGPESLGLRQRQLHFCSWGCVARFARSKVQRRAN